MWRLWLVRICSIFLLVFALAMAPARCSSAAAKPAKVKNFHLVCHGNKSAFLGWDKAKNASYYIVYRYNKTSRKYTKVKKTSLTHCRVGNLKAGKKYSFVVQSVRSSGGKTSRSAYSSVITLKAKKVNLKAIHGRYWDIRVTRGFRAKDIRTGKMVTVKAGTSALTTARREPIITVILKKGKRVKTSLGNVSFGNLVLSKSYKKYSREQSEAFINQRGYTSKTKWLIWVSQYTGSFHLFKGSKGKWKQVRMGECVIGRDGHTTPGRYQLIRRTSSNGKPKFYFTWNNAKQWGLSIHCRVDGNTRGAYSAGCVRLGDSDLYYVAEHCPLGTTVLSY